MASRSESVRQVPRSGAIAHEGFLRHRNFKWAKIASIVAVVSILLYAFDDPDPRPGGGTAYGYILGTIGAGLIVWLTALGFRKRTMTRKRWSLKAWTSAHVYLGLSLIVIGTLHTGFDLGWNIHTLAYVLMMVVILSGLVGVGLYAALPRVLSDNRGEMTEPQMIEALAALDRQLHDAAQPLEQEEAALVQDALAEDPFDAGLWRRLSGRFPPGATDAALAHLRGPGSPEDGRLEGLLDRRRAMVSRMRRHMRLRAALEMWLYVHVPTTVALLAALFAHIVSVFFYW